MKRLISKIVLNAFLLCFLLLGFGTTELSAGSAGVTFVSTPGLSVSSGVEFQTTVSLEGADSVVGFELYLTYDSDLFTIQGIQKDPSLPANLVYNIDVLGSISVNYSYLVQTLSGNLPLFTITFVPVGLPIGEHELLVADLSKNIEVTRINQSSQLEVVDAVDFAFASVRSGVYGDVSGDGQVSILDVGMIQLYLVSKFSLSAEKLALADVNDDGNVSIFDVGLIQMYLAGMIDKLGPTDPIVAVDTVETAYDQVDGTNLTLLGIITYVDISGFFLGDETGSIYVVTEGFDTTGVFPGQVVKVSGETYMNGLQPLMVDIVDVEVVSSDPIDPEYYELIATALSIGELTEYFSPSNSYDYGFVAKIDGILSLDEGTYTLTDPDTGDVIAVREVTHPDALAELADHVGEHVELIGLTYDYADNWRIVVVPGTVAVVDDVDLIRQTIVIPWLLIDGFEVSYAGGIADYESSGNDYVYFFYFPEGTTEFEVKWFLNDEVVASIALSIDIYDDHVHVFGHNGSNFTYGLVYASDCGTDLLSLLWRLYEISFNDWQPDQSHSETYHFGEIVVLDPGMVTGYELLGYYLDQDLTEPAEYYFSVLDYGSVYFDWQLESGQISHTVFWHHEGGIDSPYTEMSYAEGYPIAFNYNTPKLVGSQHGYWFEGWYLDPDLTLAAEEFALSEDVHLYPKLVAAEFRNIADTDALDPALEPFISLYGVVTYVQTHRDGTKLNLMLSDGSGTIMVRGFDYLGYDPVVGDEILVSGYMMDLLGAKRIYLTDVSVNHVGDGTYDHNSDAYDFLGDWYGDGLVQLRLYYANGTIFTNVLEDGIIRYYLELADGTVLTIHSQSTHLFADGEYHHCLEGTEGLEGRLLFYYAWNDVVFAVPGSFTEDGGEELIYQAILLPWDAIDDYQISFAGGNYGIMPTINPFVVMAEFPVGTESFYVDLYKEGDLVGQYTLAVVLDDAVHVFEYNGSFISYLLVEAASYGMFLDEMINTEFDVVFNNIEPGLSTGDYYIFGQRLFLAPEPVYGYVFEGVYLDSDFTIPAPLYLLVLNDMEIYYNWVLDPEVNHYTVYWHYDADELGEYEIDVFPEGYLVDQYLDKAMAIADKPGYWFAGWYLDAGLTLPMEEFILEGDVHLYPSFIDASLKSTVDIQSADLGQRVSLYGTVSYRMMDFEGNLIGIYLSDVNGSVIVTFDDNVGYWPILGDEILISGSVESLFGFTQYVYADSVDTLDYGEDVYDYSGAVDYLEDVEGGYLPSNHLYYATGMVRAVILESGAVRYYLDTTEGDTFTIHTQSTHVWGDDGYYLPIQDYVGETVTIAFYAGWNNVIFPVPGVFTPGNPEPLIYQAISIPWGLVDDYQVAFAGGIYGIQPTGNPNVVFAEFPEGTEEFYVTFYLDGDIVGEFILDINPLQEELFVFAAGIDALEYYVLTPEAFGRDTLGQLIQTVFYVTHDEYAPGYGKMSSHYIGEAVRFADHAVWYDNYVLDGIYFDESCTELAPEYFVLFEDQEVFFKWSVTPGANIYNVHWHYDNTVDGEYVNEIYAEGYWIDWDLDTPTAISGISGFWFEGWYLDSDLTIQAEPFAIHENVHLFPKFPDAAARTIADLAEYDYHDHISLYGTVSYLMIDSEGELVSFILTDDTGSIIVSMDDLGYGIDLGDYVLVTGSYYPIFGSSYIIYMSDLSLAVEGDGTYEYLGAVNYLDDVTADGQVTSGKLYYAEGTIWSEVTSYGVTRYYLDTTDGHTLTLHPQSTHFLVEGSYEHCMSEYDGMTGTLLFYGAWNLVVYPIPGSLVE